MSQNVQMASYRKQCGGIGPIDKCMLRDQSEDSPVQQQRILLIQGHPSSTHLDQVSHSTVCSTCWAEASHPRSESGDKPFSHLCPSPNTHIPSFPLLRSPGSACPGQGSCAGSLACDLVGGWRRELARALQPLGDQSRAESGGFPPNARAVLPQ